MAANLSRQVNEGKPAMNIEAAVRGADMTPPFGSTLIKRQRVQLRRSLPHRGIGGRHASRAAAATHTVG
jgi:hypothetical protein